MKLLTHWRLPGGMQPITVAWFLLIYVVLDRVSYIYPVAPLGITPWNPPPGLSLFLLLRFGLQYWPCLLIASLAADVLVRDFPVHWLASLLSCGGITLGYWGAAYVLRERLRLQAQLGNARDLWLFLLTLLPTALFVSVCYVGVYTLAGAVAVADFWDHVFKFWVGDLNGLFVLTPALLVHLGKMPAWRRLTRQELLEISLQAAALALTLWIIFVAGSEHEFRLFYPLFLPLVWIASRWGLRGATLALVGIQLGLIAAVQLGGYQTATFVQLQSLMLILCVTGLVLGAVVTQRSQMEAQLRERQAALSRALRFAAAGEMTSALAHELNQPMAALSAYLGACQKLLQSSGEQRERLAETLAKAVAESRRASEVVQVLRDFFKSGAVRLQTVRPLDILENAVQGIRPRCERAGIRIEVLAPANVPTLLADPLQIETALHNLLSNAADALEAEGASGGSIGIRLSAATDGLRYEVSDNGPGVPDSIRPRLFEPFNSSKEDGMGLGLAIGKTLVEAHGGTLALLEGGGRGAHFVLFLPRIQRPQTGEDN